MKQMHEILLASGSPRRRELFTEAGLDFEVVSVDVDETPNEKEPEKVAQELSRRKAAAAERMIYGETGQATERETAGEKENDEEREYDADRELTADRNKVIVAADTVVIHNKEVLGKPKDEADAVRMLTELSGAVHDVITGVTILTPDREEVTFSQRTRVRFRPLSEEEIRDYVATGEPMDKAGAYGIQNLGAMLVESIRGDYFTVMGLPVCRLALALKQYGIDPFSQTRHEYD